MSIKQGGKYSKQQRDRSNLKREKENPNYARKLANLKSCKSLALKVIKQLSNIPEPSFELEKLLRNFSDILNVVTKSKRKLCPDAFEEWLKATAQLRISSINNLADTSTEIPKSYKLKFDSSINKRYAKGKS